MYIIISYKSGLMRRIAQVEFTEFNPDYGKFYYWQFGGSDTPKSVNLYLIKDIIINAGSGAAITQSVDEGI